MNLYTSDRIIAVQELIRDGYNVNLSRFTRSAITAEIYKTVGEIVRDGITNYSGTGALTRAEAEHYMVVVCGFDKDVALQTIRVMEDFGAWEVVNYCDPYSLSSELDKAYRARVKALHKCHINGTVVPVWQLSKMGVITF